MSFLWFKNIIETLRLSLNFSKANSPSFKSSHRVNIQNKADNVQTQIAQLNVQQGLRYSEAKDLIELVLNQKLVAFKSEAENTFMKRTNDFKQLLFDKIQGLPEEELSKLREPDTQLSLLEAVKTSGRKQSSELRELLANLVVARIKNDKTDREELKNIVYNEAISTVNKLTVDQLKIITLCYLFRYTQHAGIVSWATFDYYLTKGIEPFLNFKNTRAEFQHIEYTGCGSISIGSWKLLTNYFRPNYSFLFMNPIDKLKIDELKLNEGIKQEIIMHNTKDDKYVIKVRNKASLEKYAIDKQIDTETAKKLASIYQDHIKTDEEIKKEICENTVIGKQVLDLQESSSLRHLSLTSVGIAIAASYYEQMTGEKIDINIWIN